ncbi:hypothetical protein [Streptomyces sp. ISL-100]|uniref:hypothetical protein n=1 Tax=Streptomyces sp. ISL-100 TaxID=2819173 RepID=UPI001BE672AA|nr:hypothetical protein [Streptomyces sp. ISL-100]MBT2395260.1 hypothetical protein [Streptomyces sp. ISL-100]
MPSRSALVHEHDLISNPVFCARVRMAFTRVAREVLSQQGDPGTPGNQLRVSLARSVLNPPDLTAHGMAPVIASDPDVSTAADAGRIDGQADSAQSAVTDELILAAVRNAWDLTAGVNPQNET